MQVIDIVELMTSIQPRVTTRERYLRPSTSAYHRRYRSPPPQIMTLIRTLNILPAGYSFPSGLSGAGR
jgi:hypothetical protein